ncbi:hypothetical protein KKH23_05575 [Patescibacteria group bacterium]|nr:hypothetical protein [Patescibacteria group bacterium]MBU0846641.1 hypothetical protein [Patescibacteria group bacterium]
MSRNKNIEPEVTEPVEPVKELTAVEKIQKYISDKKSQAVTERARLEAMEAETEALSTIEIDSDVEDMINTLEDCNKSIKAENDVMSEELKPLKEQVESIVASHSAAFDHFEAMKVETNAALVAKVGEVGAKAILGGSVTVKKTGSGTGKSKRTSGGVSKRDIVVKATCDEHLTLAQAVERYPELESVDGARKNLWKPINDGLVVKNSDGTFSYA